MDFLRVFVIKVMDFPTEIMFPMEVPLEMDCYVFLFGFEILTTSISLAKKLCNHKLSKVMGFVGKKPRFFKT
jgi:hypothetical protein